MGTLLTILSALGGVAGVAGVAAFFLIPGAAPIISAVLSVAGAAIGRYITTLWKGLQTIVSNPAALVTAGTLLMAGIGVGVSIEMARSDHRVENVKRQFNSFKDHLRKNDERAQQDVADALEAREAAEEKARREADDLARAVAAGRMRGAAARASAGSRQ